MTTEKKAPIKQHIVFCLLCENQYGILYTLSKIIANQGCSIEASRMTALGTVASISMLISGSWDAIAKLEAHFPALEKKYSGNLYAKRTSLEPGKSKDNATKENLISYTIELVTPENQGIISALSGFFSEQSLNIYEVYSNSFVNQLGTLLSTMVMRVHIPTDLQISDLRERFMLLCDDLNIDAVLEPDRS